MSNSTIGGSEDTGEYNDGGISAILTINLIIFGVTVVVMTVMRRRQENEQVYLPRVLPGSVYAKTLSGAAVLAKPEGILGWITGPGSVTELDILYRYGLDTTMYLRFMQMVCKLFLVSAVLCGAILVPINRSGNQNEVLSKADNDKKWTRGFNDWVVTNLPEETDKLWAHYVVFLIITASIYVVAFAFGHAFYSLRRKHQELLKRKQNASSHTIMIRNIPGELRTEEPIYAALEKQYPGHVVKVWLVFHHPALEKLRVKQVALRRKLEVAIGTLRKHGSVPDGSMAARLRELDMLMPPVTERIKSQIAEEDTDEKKKEKRAKNVEKSEKKMAEIVEKLEEVHTKIAEEMVIDDQDKEEGHKTTRTAFAMFDTMATAQACAQNYYYTLEPTALRVEGIQDTRWEVSMAPESDDLIWKNLVHRSPVLTARKLAFNAATVWLVIFWAIPVGILGSLEGLASLPAGIGNSFKWLQDLPGFVVGFLGAYLPMIVAIAFNALLPKILSFIAVQEGTLTHSERKTKVLKKFYLFTLFSVIILPSVFIGSLSKLGEIVQEITNDPVNQILSLVTEITSPKTGLFCALLIQTAFAASGLALLRPAALVLPRIMKKIAVTPRQKVDALRYPEFDYHIEYARLGLMFAITMLFSITMPITVPFGAILFLFKYMVDRYNLLYVLPNPKQNVDTNPPAMIRLVMITCIVLQIAVTGMFIGKKAIPQAALSAINILICYILNGQVDDFWDALFRTDWRIETPIGPDAKTLKARPADQAPAKAGDEPRETDKLLEPEKPDILTKIFGVFNAKLPETELVDVIDDEDTFNPQDHLEAYVHPGRRDLDEPPPDDPDDEEELQAARAQADLEAGTAAPAADAKTIDTDTTVDPSPAPTTTGTKPLPVFIEDNETTANDDSGRAVEPLPPLKEDG